MPFALKCAECGSRLKARDELAGRLLPCPKCHSLIQVPPATDEDATSYLLQDETAKPKPQTVPPQLPELESEPEPAEPKRRRPDLSSVPPLTAKETPTWLRHLHWVLILALIPLAFSLLGRDDDESSPLQRLAKTLKELPAEEQTRIDKAMDQVKESDDHEEKLISLLPDQRISGSLLGRNSRTHWLMALGATIAFMAFFMFLASDGCANPLHLLSVGLFTATLGVAMLLILQTMADWSAGRIMYGRSVIVVFFYLIKFIGFSYSAALDPDNGFLLSFLGYTLGVGLCEEIVKALPLLWYYRNETEQNWRGAFLWGLASGAGFGIAEGILYSGNYYNGIHTGGIYLVRFVSCVALHAVWTGSVAILINQKQDWFQSADTWYEMILPILGVIAIPMILHGLYDTLLKKDMPALALLIAVVSFAYLAFLNYRLHNADDADANRQMLREYARRRKAMA